MLNKYFVMKNLKNKYFNEVIFLIIILIEIIICYSLYLNYWPLSSLVALFIGLLGTTISFYGMIYTAKKNKENIIFQLNYNNKRNLLVDIYSYLRKMEEYEEHEWGIYLASCLQPISDGSQIYFLPKKIQNDIFNLIKMEDECMETYGIVDDLFYDVVTELNENYNFKN